MKQTGRILIVLVVLACSLKSFAQPQIKFESVTHDYGTIKEEDGPQKAVFTFTNIGNEPLTITNVRASCGCTASNYTKESVAPGSTGVVEVTYNPANRPGQFAKSVSVTSNDPNTATVVLTIRGTTTPKPKTKADNYPSKIGNLKFKTNHLAFQEMNNNQVRTDTLGVYNMGRADITISGTKDLPDFITIEIIPQTIKYDEEGIILITYNALKRNDFGYVFDKFNLLTNDTELPEKLLYVSANIVYDFSNMTEKQKARAPKIEFDAEAYNYGQVQSGTVVEHSFVFMNNGKDPLKILKTKPSCGCTASELELTELKRGKSSKINVKFHTQGRNGQQHHNITIHTNDPEKPVVVLYLQGEVIK